ncbi:pyridoxamine 5'-phosphate oxidase family protein [Halorubrum sp. JWXQ-INN 858]|uniref:pyridoxamine 5'-phosphate oxidase family protein n=1 Tax=Halorubrum sp. JWXQ-INN 858 TaxID=2690782 RepID=UPI001358B7D2|nr:pyridoxamine 5'-phosphate oxidase family protein [Halorubrum sp. JWXQ-INN 858]MWV66028.1 pyridoxamine 5'-phosphate oxidase family protein [Halorubrum sp. JWXQ-INN 858]
MKHVEYAYTTGMDDAEIDDRLRTAASGVLALCDDGDAHAVPLAHYYDGERLYFRLGTTEGSKKRELWERTGTASYVLHGTEPTDDPQEIDSWSVVVTGRLVELPESERERFDTAEINRRFSPIRVFGEAIEEIEVSIVELEIDTVTGRVTSDGARGE